MVTHLHMHTQSTLSVIFIRSMHIILETCVFDNAHTKKLLPLASIAYDIYQGIA